LRLVNEELLSGEHEPGAVYIPHNRAIYVPHGDVYSWAAVAREIAAVICVTSDPAHIASQLKDLARFGGDLEETEAEAPGAPGEEELHGDGEDAHVEPAEADEELAGASADGRGTGDGGIGTGGERTARGSRGRSTGERGDHRARPGSRRGVGLSLSAATRTEMAPSVILSRLRRERRSTRPHCRRPRARAARGPLRDRDAARTPGLRRRVARRILG
jgi:hypothetical protein